MTDLVLNHPNSFFPHFVDNAEDVDRIVFINSLKNSVQSDESAGPADARRTVHYNWLIAVRRAPLSERTHELDQSLRRFGNAEIWPSGEVEMAYDSRLIALLT